MEILSDSRREEIFNNLLSEKQKRYELIAKGEPFEIDPNRLTSTQEELQEDTMLSKARSSLQKLLIEGRRMRRSHSSFSFSTYKTEEIRPKFTDLSTPKSTGQQESEPNSARLERIDQLARPKSETIKQRILKKQENEDNYIQKHCTFKPQINRKSCDSSIPVEDRLLNNWKVANSKKEALISLSKERRYSFRPSILPSKSEEIPLYKRINQINVLKKEKMEQLRETHEYDPNLTFKPSINPVSEELARNKKERLSQTRNNKKDIPIEKIGENHASAEDKEKTISEFLTRQSDFLKAKEDHLKKKIAHQAEKQACSHQPSINSQSRQMTSAMHEENFHEKIDRMSSYENFRRMKARAKREYLHYSKFSFIPKIKKYRKSLLIEPPKTKPEETKKESPSFKPKINPSNVDSHYKDDVMKGIESGNIKKELFASAVKAREEQKLKAECTFQPKINENVQQNKNAPIHGLHQFLENRERAKKLAAELRQREQKVFGQKSQSLGSVTIPQPFLLSKHSHNHCKLEADHTDPCTFKPETIEA